MNNELIRKKIELEKQIDRFGIIKLLERSVIEYGGRFKRESSIKALKEINEYLKIKEKELISLERQFIKVQDDIYFSCKHEVLMKPSSDYVCPICKRSFFKDDIHFDHYFIETEENINMDQIIEEIALRDENIEEVLENYLIKNFQKVRIYRRHYE